MIALTVPAGELARGDEITVRSARYVVTHVALVARYSRNRAVPSPGPLVRVTARPANPRRSYAHVDFEASAKVRVRRAPAFELI